MTNKFLGWIRTTNQWWQEHPKSATIRREMVLKWLKVKVSGWKQTKYHRKIILEMPATSRPGPMRVTFPLVKLMDERCTNTICSLTLGSWADPFRSRSWQAKWSGKQKLKWKSGCKKNLMLVANVAEGWRYHSFAFCSGGWNFVPIPGKRRRSKEGSADHVDDTWLQDAPMLVSVRSLPWVSINGASRSSHPFLDGIFHHKLTILGIPHLWNPPHIIHFLIYFWMGCSTKKSHHFGVAPWRVHQVLASGDLSN